MKICMLATSYPRYLGDRHSVFVHGLSKTLVSKGMQVVAVVPHEKGVNTQDSFEGVTVKRFRYLWPESLEQVAYDFGIPDNLRYKFWAKIGLPFFMLAFLIKAWRETKACDLIHAHWEIAALIGLLVRWRRKIPVVFTVHRLVTKSFLSRYITRFILRHVDMLHFNSSYTQELARQTAPPLPRNEVIYPSIDVETFKPGKPAKSLRRNINLGAEVPIILGLGRLVEKKGFQYLIEAFAALRQEGLIVPPPFLVIAGGGPLMSELQALAARLCPAGSFHFTDFVFPEQTIGILQEATVMVAPSIADSHGEIETLGMVSMEAMACGVPVIASRIGGIPDVIQDRTCGILVAPKDPHALKAAILEILQNPALAQTFIRNSKTRVEEMFTWTQAGRATVESYKTLVDNKAR